MMRPDFPLRFVPIAVILLACCAASATAQKELAISAIQGDKNASPFQGEAVKVSGIVTARTKTGFFIQTPDDKADTNPNTSEGIFVFTRNEPPVDAAIGNLVSLTGTVEEFRPRSEPHTLPITEVSMRADRDSINVVSRSNSLPKPLALTLADFKANSVDQLERLEGMRVQIDELLAIAPTDGRVDIATSTSQSSGTFFGVLKGLNRPFREPGLDVFEFAFQDNKDKDKMRTAVPKLPIFDGNPERLRIESSGQLGGSALDVAANSEVKNITGVMHYSYRTNTILVDADSRPAVSSTIKSKALPATTPAQFSVAGMNLENFFDDQDDPGIKEDIVSPEGFQRRLKKISLAIRDVLQMPDVIAVIEAENLAALKRLADKINADTVAAGKLDPKYTAYLNDGNDGRGIDSGFLVKSSRVKVIEVKQIGKDEKYKNPNTGEENFLNDRPPLMLRVAIDNGGKPFEFTVIANHLKSYLGYSDPKQQNNVRLKKRLQAEFLATLVQERQKSNPAERIILLGDFNSYQFSDGILDMIGTITGKPSPKDSVLNYSDDLVNPDLIDLVNVIDAKQRYSYVFDGNAQVLDHIIINETLRNHIKGFGYARVNADFPEIFRNDDSRPERFSDHDPAVAYFSIDEAGKQP